MAFRGGLSFNLADVIVPAEKEALVNAGYEEVENIMADYNQGWITNNARYNKIIDTWTEVNNNLSKIVMKQLTEDNQGFNSVYMMLDSGARGSREQIRQLGGMRGLLAKPQNAGAEGGKVNENKSKANVKECLYVLEYLSCTHRVCKGLADNELQTGQLRYVT